MIIQIVVGVITCFTILFLSWIFISKYRRLGDKTEKQIVASKGADNKSLIKFLIGGLPCMSIPFTFFIDYKYLANFKGNSLYQLLYDNGMLMLILIAIFSFFTYRFIIWINNKAFIEDDKNVKEDIKVRHRAERNSHINSQLLYVCSAVITILITVLMIMYLMFDFKNMINYALKWMAILLGKYIWFDKFDINKPLIFGTLNKLISFPILFFGGITILGAVMGFVENVSNNSWINDISEGFISGGFVASGVLGGLGILCLLFPRIIPKEWLKSLNLD